MAEYSDWVDAISVHLPNCPRVAIIHAVKQTVIEFCERSLAWVYQCEETALIDSGAILDLPINSTICHTWALQGRTEIHCCGNDPAFFVEPPNLLQFDDPERLTLTSIKPLVSLKPTQDALSCPDFIALDYFDGIASGAVAYLQQQPREEWSAPNMVQIHLQRFEAAITRGVRKRNNGFGKSKACATVKSHYL